MDKACAVVLHPDGAPMRLLAFRHPKAGCQLVKGTVRPGETPAHAAARELMEEAGVETLAALPLGCSGSIVDGETWHFTLCRAKRPLRAAWRHFCHDDGGHMFEVFWADPADPPAFEGRFDRALSWIRARLSGGSISANGSER